MPILWRGIYPGKAPKNQGRPLVGKGFPTIIGGNYLGKEGKVYTKGF